MKSKKKKRRKQNKKEDRSHVRAHTDPGGRVNDRYEMQRFVDALCVYLGDCANESGWRSFISDVVQCARK